MKRKVPVRNYIILLVVLIISALFVIYICEWIKTYKENSMSISPLSDVVNEVNSNELYLSLSESNQMILYVGYNNNNEIRSLERDLLKVIKGRNLTEYFIYYNVSDELENNKYLDTLKKEFPEVQNDIKKAPMIIYIKNGKAIEVVNSTNETLITKQDFESLIDRYEIND